MSSERVVCTSDGLRDLLIRHGVVPTMDRAKDLKAAKKFMSKPYSQYLEKGKAMQDLILAKKFMLKPKT